VTAEEVVMSALTIIHRKISTLEQEFMQIHASHRN
jgi:hypothetical protein